MAVSEAQRSGAKLHAIPVTSEVDPEDDKKTANDLARQPQDLVDEQVPHDVSVETRIHKGASVHRNVRKAAQERACALIVMNAHSPDLRDDRIGYNASQVVRHASCSVLVVR